MGSMGLGQQEAILKTAGIQATFALLDEVSDTNRALEQQVEQLSTQLERVDDARLRELEAKERVNERLQSLLNMLPGGVVVLDNRGIVVDCNPAAQTMLEGVLCGEKWVDVIQRSFAPRKDDGHEISLISGRRVSVATRSLDKDSGQVVLLTDLTETRELQDRLSRHQRLTAMGRMMAALAHQIRTPLSAAMLYGSHLHERELSQEQIHKFSGKLMSRLHHMEQQIRDMLIFVRGEVPLRDLVSVSALSDAIENALEVQLEQFAGSLAITIDCDPKLSLQCNHDALVGAVVNLVNNALQAEGQNAHVELNIDGNDRCLTISVSDHGPGIDKRTLAAMSDPFFTTKPKGTGLGLAVARSVARAHGGDLAIQSKDSIGTVATITISLQAESGT